MRDRFEGISVGVPMDRLIRASREKTLSVLEWMIESGEIKPDTPVVEVLPILRSWIKSFGGNPDA